MSLCLAAPFGTHGCRYRVPAVQGGVHNSAGLTFFQFAGAAKPEVRSGLPGPTGCLVQGSKGVIPEGGQAGRVRPASGLGGRDSRRQGVPREDVRVLGPGFPPGLRSRAPTSPRLFSLRNHSKRKEIPTGSYATRTSLRSHRSGDLVFPGAWGSTSFPEAPLAPRIPSPFPSRARAPPPAPCRAHSGRSGWSHWDRD